MIEADSLTMYYGHKRALSNASFVAADHAVMGLLGPNGAGKTTTMNILTTQMVPTEGTARVCGYDILKEPLEVRRVTGYLPETTPLYAEMEVEEYLRFVGNARGLGDGKLKERLDWVCETCSLAPVYRMLIGHLSRGFRQRVGLAQALIHDPQVLVLDEPTAGLDPVQIIGIRRLIKELAKSKTVIFSTHILQEASAVSDRLVIINNGYIIADGTAEELISEVNPQGTTVLRVKADRNEVEKSLSSLQSVKDVVYTGGSGGVSSFHIAGDDQEKLWLDIAELIKDKGWLVKELHPEAISLEDTFLELIKREAGRTEAA